jgi:hypothetical protein
VVYLKLENNFRFGDIPTDGFTNAAEAKQWSRPKWRCTVYQIYGKEGG